MSPDPDLVEKVRDLVGLYLNPPDAAAVFAVDEKPQIQALIKAWSETWNANPKPFVWHKTAEQILDRLAGYCAAINQGTTA